MKMEEMPIIKKNVGKRRSSFLYQKMLLHIKDKIKRENSTVINMIFMERVQIFIGLPALVLPI